MLTENKTVSLFRRLAPLLAVLATFGTIMGSATWLTVSVQGMAKARAAATHYDVNCTASDGRIVYKDTVGDVNVSNGVVIIKKNDSDVEPIRISGQSCVITPVTQEGSQQ